MAESIEFTALMHKRNCLEHELDTIVQLGMDASNTRDSYRKFMVSCLGLTRIQDQFDQIQSSIENLELKETNTLSPEHSNIRSAFNDLIRDIMAIKFGFEDSNSKSEVDRNCNTDEKSANIPVHLPRLFVPTFSGDYKQWNSFSDLFSSLIDQNKGLSDVAKLQYLLSYVRGDASKLLKGLPITVSNYKKAWSILEYNYKNDRLIAMQHMDALYKLPNLNSPSATGLRTILSGFLENIGALEPMGFHVDEWDFILYYMLYRKIDPNTRRDFDKSIATNNIPKFSELQEFLNREIVAWESSRPTSRSLPSHSSSQVDRSRTTSTFVTCPNSSNSSQSNSGASLKSHYNCIFCKHSSHSLFSCSSFKQKKSYDRFIFARQKKLCLKCLKPMHGPDNVCAKICCSICNATHHHTFLHFAKTPERFEDTSPQSNLNSDESANVVSLYSTESAKQNMVLLSTAMVLVRDASGKFVSARALVDPGSEASFVTEDLVSRLGLSRHKVGTPVQGIGDLTTCSKGYVTTIIKSRVDSGSEFNLRALILNHITSNKPSNFIDKKSWSHLKHLLLADPNFNSLSSVDILLGGDIYDDIFVGETIRGPLGTPMAISSSLGWLLIGKVDLKFVRNINTNQNISSFVVLNQENSLDNAVRKFWEIESIPEKSIISPDDEQCEKIFVESHKRLESGRFEVSLPFGEGEPSLGESRSLALKRLLSPERRRPQKIAVLSVKYSEEPSFLNRYSSFHKLIKIISYCRRFIHNCRSKSSKLTGPLLVSELQSTTLRLVGIVQKFSFAQDLQNIESGKICTTRLQRLSPFLDKQGLIRVGGRLTNSDAEFSKKHPLVLPPESNFTKLLVNYFHEINLHSGLQATLAYIARSYWIISARRVVKKSIFQCIKCYRYRAVTLEPKMADLPSARVQQVRPFIKVAVDYAGPFTTKSGTVRKAKHEKSYICVFSCLTTRALHIELVSSLTTDAFMAALRRFISRRGMCSDIFSDNGKNFVGASSELKVMYNFVKDSNIFIAQSLLKFKIAWHFNPPAAPHFTGMAEAAVKSIKSHLVRIVGNAILTFEEMVTVLTQIESILNSRPLCPLTSDPNDLEALTPGHFLIGEPLNAFADPDLTDISLGRLARWRLLQRFIQDFWKRWHNEYLHTLQQRGKWTKSIDNIRVGTLVLVNDPNLPPLQWKLGRVTEIYPSKDGVIRSVALKTQQGFLKRPVHRLSPLPI